MPSCVILYRVALVRTDVSEERIAYMISVTRIGELGATLAVTIIRSKQRGTRRKIPEDGILQTYWVSVLCPSSGILYTRNSNI
jgi:hypothetical protein